MSVYYHKKIYSPIGRLTLVSTSTHLKALLWNFEPESRGYLSNIGETSTNSVLENTENQLAEYFSGQRKIFDLPLDPDGTLFQKNVWNLLIKIPYGIRYSYGQLASELGDARKARAVGAANGKNPIGIIVPCHRVIGKNGDLTGFAGGLEIKRFLLDLESNKH